MIPYYEMPSIELFGPFQIHPFGLLVGIGILLGAWFAQKRAREYGISQNEMSGAIWWAVVVGFIGAHWFEVFFYHPEQLRRDGIVALLKLWDGISSYGGFLGAFIGLSIYFYRLRKPWMRHADILVQALIVGWVFGRLGCTIVHDHPGRLTDFFMAVQYPGGTRHNLGMYEFLYTLFVLVPGILLLHRRRPPAGSFVVFATMAYAPIRFYLDFLRAEDRPGSDLRYLGLTAAQYASIGLFAYGGWLWARIRRRDKQQKA